MDVIDILGALLRWFHIAAGILWVGLLYFFNFSYIQFAASLEGESRKKVVLDLIPRSVYWFRWGAIYTWVTGFLLLGLLYYHGGLMFEANNISGWMTGSIVMAVTAFLLFGLYDVAANSGLSKSPALFALTSFIAIAVILYLMVTWGRFSYRAYNIHIGAMFGTIMAANVWMRIWPAQKKLFSAIKEGIPPDQTVMAVVAARSRHNTYLSLPIVWTMINAHTPVPAADSWLYLLGVVAAGWGIISLIYKKADKLTGV